MQNISRDMQSVKDQEREGAAGVSVDVHCEDFRCSHEAVFRQTALDGSNVGNTMLSE